LKEANQNRGINQRNIQQGKKFCISRKRQKTNQWWD